MTPTSPHQTPAVRPSPAVMANTTSAEPGAAMAVGDGGSGRRRGDIYVRTRCPECSLATGHRAACSRRPAKARPPRLSRAHACRNCGATGHDSRTCNVVRLDPVQAGPETETRPPVSASFVVCRDHLRHGDVANGCARVPAGAMCARCFRPARCPVVVRRREG